MKHISAEDIKKHEKRYAAQLINSLTAHKPIVLIGTCAKGGSENLAIFNSLVHIGAHPALMGFISRPNSVDRHTIENIRENTFYTINHVNQELYQRAHQTSARYPREQSEFDQCNIEKEYLNNSTIPFVKESPLKMHMKLEQIIDIKINNTIMCIGSIQSIYLPEMITESDGFINIKDLDLVCGSGLDAYYETKFIKRLPYAKA